MLIGSTEVPDLIIGSIIALSGVLIADLRNSARQAKQHAFDAGEKDRDRKLILRKEVYLPVAKALADVQGKIAILPLSDNPAEAQSAITNLSAVLGSMALVSETSTAILSVSVLGKYSSAYLQAGTAQMVIQSEQNKLNRINARREAAQVRYAAAITEYRKQLPELGLDDMPPFEAVLHEANEEFRLATEEYDEKNREFGLLCLKSSADNMEILEVAEQESIPLLMSLRREFGVLTDEQELRSAMRNQTNEMKARVKAMLDAITTQVSVDDVQKPGSSRSDIG